jgi:hypothetical protein
MVENKKKFASRMGAIRFATLWTLAYALGWGSLIVSGIVASNLFLDFLQTIPLWGIFAIGGFVPGLISSVGQQGLIKRKFNISIPRWWLWSTLAWTGAGALMRLIEYTPIVNINNEQVAITLAFSLFFIPPAIVQAWMLRKHIARAWMLPLAALVSSSTFVLPLLASNMIGEVETVLAFGAAGLMQGAVMGLSLLWLFGMSNSEKTKKDYVEEAYERRLTEQEIIEYDDTQEESFMWERSELQ